MSNTRLIRPQIPLNKGGQYNFVMDDSKYPAMVAGMGSGKSHGLHFKTLRRIEQNIHVLCDDHPALYMAPTYRQVHNLVPPFLSKLDLYGVPYTFTPSSDTIRITYKGVTFPMKLVSAENYDKYMGPEYCFMVADELDLCFNGKAEKTQRMFDKFTTRLRVNGSSASIDTACSPEGFGFMWENWEDRPRENPELLADYPLHRARTIDNVKNLPSTYIEKLRRDLPPQLVSAYLEGEFVPLNSGLAYTEFKRDLHCDASKIRYFDDRPIGFCFDFNLNPMTCTVVQRHPRFKYYMALYTHVLGGKGKDLQSGTTEMSKHLVGHWQEHNGGVAIYGDASGDRAWSSSAGKSDRSIIDDIIGTYFSTGKRGGYQTVWGTRNPLQRDRVNSVNALLMNAAGYTRLYFHPKNCKPLWRDLIRQTWIPGRPKLDDQNGTVGHCADGLGYFVWAEHPLKRQAMIRSL